MKRALSSFGGSWTGGFSIKCVVAEMYTTPLGMFLGLNRLRTPSHCFHWFSSTFETFLAFRMVEKWKVPRTWGKTNRNACYPGYAELNKCSIVWNGMLKLQVFWANVERYTSSCNPLSRLCVGWTKLSIKLFTLFRYLSHKRRFNPSFTIWLFGYSHL